jgi:hypothetical protein
MIRYDLDTLQPLQAIVSIDATGDFTLLYQPVSDPLLSRVLSYRRLLPPSTSTRPPLKPPLLASSALRKLYTSLPFAPNLSQPDFIPSKAVLFLERLRKRLPNHRLLVADFSELPEAVKGRNGPVVQTRYGQSMVPCETFLVKQGYFDIFFPTSTFTVPDLLSHPSPPPIHCPPPNQYVFSVLIARADFELLGETYSLIMNSPSPSTSPSDPTSLRDDFFTHSVRGFRRRQVGIHPQTEFLRTFGGEEVMSGTRTRDGISVLEGMYGNAKIMF